MITTMVTTTMTNTMPVSRARVDRPVVPVRGMAEGSRAMACSKGITTFRTMVAPILIGRRAIARS